MIVDSRAGFKGAVLEADICLIGAGAAGIALAMELSKTALDVVLLESGGLSADPASQSLNEGDNIGIDYEPLERARSQFFGGGTNCWGGWCRPLDEFDFEERSWIPGSGWPFGRSALASHYRAAAAYLDTVEEYHVEDWRERLRASQRPLLPLAGNVVENLIIQLSPPANFGLNFRTALARAPRIKVLLYANATELATDEYARRVEAVCVKTLSGSMFKVRAHRYVLCSGGLENARLLLLSDRARPAGLGNEFDVVGRYFMDHPRMRLAQLRLKDSYAYRRLYDATMAMTRRKSLGVARRRVAAHLAPSYGVQREMRLPNSRSYFVARYAADMSKGYLWLRDTRRRWRGRRVFGYSSMSVLAGALSGLPAALKTTPLAVLGVIDLIANPAFVNRELQLETIVEPVPNPDSRVTLARQVDRLNLRRAVVDWRLTGEDYRAAERVADIVVDELERQGLVARLGRRHSACESLVSGCWHHMGATRMHRDPRKGVVDENLRVHGVDNLFICGSSVFPTAGSDCPTITIVALSLRLAEHLTRRKAA